MPDDGPKQSRPTVDASAPRERADVMSTSAGLPTTFRGGGRPQTLQKDSKLKESGDEYGIKVAFGEEKEE